MNNKDGKDQLSLFGAEPLEASEKETSVAVAEPSASLTTEEAPQEQKRGRGRPPRKLVDAIRAQRRAGVLIPDKLYFAISEVAEVCGVKPYVLRYWESEFKLLRPSKNPSGQRMYQRKDIDMVFRIKRFLYEEGFTISGAKKKLKDDRKQEIAEQKSSNSKEALSKIRGELSNILSSVKK